MEIIAIVFIAIDFLKFVMLVLTMQRYNHSGCLATNDYELYCILHHRKNETQLSKISIAIYENKQKV